MIVGKFEQLSEEEIKELHTAVQSIYKIIHRL
jgi:hypothetical protein